MSAFIVSKNHIDTLVKSACDISNRNPDATGQILMDENYKSVNHRYGKDEKPPKYEYSVPDECSSVQIIKACHCYDYQACETDEYEGSEAQKIIKGIVYYESHNIPGYDKAQWCL